MEKDLIEGKLDWPRVRQITSLPKDADRFDAYVVLPQERVPSPEKILLPLGEHPYVVAKGEATHRQVRLRLRVRCLN